MNRGLRRLGIAAGLALAGAATAAAFGIARAPHSAFAVTVLDERGQSVGGARVSISSERSFLGVTKSTTYDAETWPDGRAEFAAVTDGLLHVRVEHSGFDDYAISYRVASDGVAEVRLRRAAATVGPAGAEVVVADPDESPVALATVVVSGERSGRPFNFESVTDERGRALFPFATPGLTRLSVRKDGFLPIDLTYVIAERDRIALRLSP